MFKPIISRPIVRMAAVACAGSIVALAIVASPGANELGSQVRDVATQTDASATSAGIAVPVKGNGCSVHGWPNFEPKCQFDLREPAAEARTIRVIALR